MLFSDKTMNIFAKMASTCFVDNFITKRLKNFILNIYGRFQTIGQTNYSKEKGS